MNNMFESLVIYVIPKEEKGSPKGNNDDVITITPYKYKIKKGRANISHVKVSYRVKSNPSQAVNYTIMNEDDLYNYIDDLFRMTDLDTEPYEGINVLLPGFPNWMYSIYDEKDAHKKKFEYVDVLVGNSKIDGDDAINIREEYIKYETVKLEKRIELLWGRIEKMMNGVWPTRHSLIHADSDSDSETSNSDSTDSDSVESS